MRRIRTASAAVSALALFAAAACSPEAEAPPAPVTPSPAPAGTPAPPVAYACESGQSVTVAYPDTANAQLTYRGQSYTLRTVQSASGARYAGSGLEWWSATRDGANGYLRRLAGRLETGADSISDPAMGGPALLDQARRVRPAA